MIFAVFGGVFFFLKVNFNQFLKGSVIFQEIINIKKRKKIDFSRVF